MKSPSQADLVPEALTAHGEWTGTRYNVFVAAYNTKLIKKDELPKSYDDLLDPRWKGKMAWPLASAVSKPASSNLRAIGHYFSAPSATERFRDGDRKSVV